MALREQMVSPLVSSEGRQPGRLRSLVWKQQPGTLGAQVFVPRAFISVWYDLSAAFFVTLELMMVPDTLLALTSVFLSIFGFRDFFTKLASNLTWNVVSFLVAFPLQNAIREAYRRGLVSNIYVANVTWEWPGADAFNGRLEDGRPKELGGTGVKKKPCDKVLSKEHPRRILNLLLRLLDALEELLLVPRTGHARYRFCCGRAEKLQADGALMSARVAVMRLLTRLHGATEDLKASGMPPNEASRINNYIMHLQRSFERLWVAKTYHTPVALRALLRIVIQFLPFVYGPYWMYIAKGDDETLGHAGILFATLFSSMISLLLIAMVNLSEQVENPFRPDCLDTVRVKEEMELARQALHAAAADHVEVWHERLRFEWEMVEASR